MIDIFHILGNAKMRKEKYFVRNFSSKNFFVFFQITAPAAVDTWELRLKTETERDLKGICKFTFTKTVDNAKFAVILVRNKMRVFRYKNFIGNLAERNIEYLEKLWAKTSIYPL